MITILFEGLHTNHKGDGFYTIHPLTSSVTLVQHEGKNILIDTGSLAYEKRLIDELAAHGFTSEDIHYVCNSHYHLDHCSNNHLFRNAINYVSVATLDYKTGICMVYEKHAAHRPSPPGITPIPTPGHTVDSFSYFYTDEHGTRYICAGDAVREDIIRAETRVTAHAEREFWGSMKKIFEMADVVIPGHGRIIEGSLKEELQQFVEEHYRLIEANKL